MEWLSWLKSAHSLLRYAVLITLVYAVLRALLGFLGKRKFDQSDDKASLWAMMSCDLQLTLGLILYFVGDLGFNNLRLRAVAEVMKNSVLRFFAVEHILMMLIAIILVHIGRSKIKKGSSDVARHRSILLFYGIALIIILASIPWPFRAQFAGYSWF